MDWQSVRETAEILGNVGIFRKIRIKYIDFTVAFCVKHRSLWQPDPLICNNLLDTIEKEYKKVQEMKELVLQLTRTEGGSHRQRRDIFNIVGYAAHSLFGILDSDHETFITKRFFS